MIRLDHQEDDNDYHDKDEKEAEQDNAYQHFYSRPDDDSCLLQLFVQSTTPIDYFLPSTTIAHLVSPSCILVQKRVDDAPAPPFYIVSWKGIWGSGPWTNLHSCLSNYDPSSSFLFSLTALPSCAPLRGGVYRGQGPSLRP